MKKAKRTKEVIDKKVKSTKGKRRIKINLKRYFQVLGISLALVLGIGAVCMGLDFSKAKDEGALTPVDITEGKINVLLMGVDVEGFRTDAIMVASYDIKAGKVNLLSIPRDTRMYIGKTYQKINAAHAIGGMTGKIAGPEGTIEAVTRLTAIPINYYVEFSFTAIDHFIDALGGVTFNVPDVEGNGRGMNYDDPVQDLHIHLKPGEQTLTGNQCQQLLRYRKSNPINGKTISYPDGDRGRIEVQQQFVKALVQQKVNAKLILKVPDLFNQLSQDIKTNFTLGTVTKYAAYLKDFKSENITAYGLPGENNGTDYGASYWICNLDETKTLVQDVFGYDASKITIDSADGSSASKDKKKTTSSSSSGKATASPTKKPAVTESPKKGQTEGDNEDASYKEAEPTLSPTKEPIPKPADQSTPKPTSKPAEESTNGSNSEKTDTILN